MNTEHGLIGLFDILGYQNFLKNNSAKEAAESALSSLAKLDTDLPKQLLERAGASQIASEIRLIKWLVFSDTILLTLGTDGKGDEGCWLAWIAFIVQSGALWRHMFNFGLPLRGVITHGEFFVQNNCFAGKSIVGAYALSTSLDVAVADVSA